MVSVPKKQLIHSLCLFLALLIFSFISIASAESGELKWENVTLNQPLSVDAGKELTLELVGNNTLNSYIYVPKGTTLNIVGKGNLTINSSGYSGYSIGAGDCGNIRIATTGTLTINPNTYGCAIGGDYFESITIDSGTIIAEGRTFATVIGGENAGRSGGVIQINGGSVKVTSSAVERPANGIYSGNNGTLVIRNGTVDVYIYMGGVGIGGGNNSSTLIYNGKVTSHGCGNGEAAIGGKEGSSVTIYNGTVRAICDTVLFSDGAAIGGGKNHKVTINGGNVTAQAGYYAAAIGGNAGVGGGNITINGGTVTATGSTHDGAAIGGGQNGSGGNVIIRGGTVTAKFGTRYKDMCPDVIGRGNGGSTSGKLIVEPYGTEISVKIGENESNIYSIDGSPFSEMADIATTVCNAKFFVANGPAYSETEIDYSGFISGRDGWCIPNYGKGLGYIEGETYEYSQYFSTGFSLVAWLKAVIGADFDQGITGLEIKGNCFGLSLLAIAQYNNQIDLKPFFEGNEGSFLNTYGYSQIIEDVFGRASGFLYSLEGNDTIIDVVRRAQLSQYGITIGKAKVFGGDNDFSEVLSYLNGENVKPLLVSVSNHALVTDTSRKPIRMGIGKNTRYRIYCYDCNSPTRSSNSEGIELLPYYNYSQSYIELYPMNSMWLYYHNGSVDTGGYNSSLFESHIEFYDISKLPRSFFFGTHEISEQDEFNWVYSSDVEVSTADGQLLLSKQGSKIEQYSQEVEYRQIVGTTLLGESDNNIIINPPDQSDPVFISEGLTKVVRFDDDHLIAYSVNGKARLTCDDASNIITIDNISLVNVLPFEIAIQNQNGKKVIYAEGKLDCGTSIVLQTQFSEDGDIVTAQTTSDEDLIETLFILDGYSEKTDYHKRSVLNGTLTLSGLPVVNQILVASVSDSNNTGVLTFSWKRDEVKIAEGTTYMPTADDIGKALTCEVTSTVETGCISATTAVIAKQAGPAAPVSLIGVAPTLFNGRNGKIVGTTAEMELSDAASFASTIACGNGETDSLAAGTYYVRYKETETASAGEYATVVVPEYIKKSPVIQYPEGNQIVNVEIGQTASMSVVAENGTDYQWFVDRNDGKGFVAIHGAGKESYTTTPTKKENEGYRYFCRVTNIDGFVDSPIFTLHVVQLDSLPETGDHSNWVYWMIMAVACTAAVFLLVHKQRAE